MTAHLTADEIVRALREFVMGGKYPIPATLLEAADCIESLQTQLAESQRRLDAAEGDIRLAAKGMICDICTHSGEDAGDKNSACWNCTRGNPKFEWRGPQEAVK